MESKFVKIKGNYNIHYLEEGEGDEVLVLLHGVPVNSSLYKKIIPLLSKKFRVIAPDFIGFGKSDKPLNFDYNLKGYTDIFKAFVNALGLEKISIGAMDLGLMIAVNYAVNNPKYIDKLILFEGFVQPIEIGVKNMDFVSKFALSLMKNDKIAFDLLVKNGEKTVKSFISSGLVTKLSDEELMEYTEQFKDKDLREKIWFKGIGPHTIKKDKILSETVAQNFEKLKSKKFPILLLHGESGQVIRKNSIEFIKENLPSIKVKSVGKGKHFLPLEAYEKMAEEILEFYKRGESYGL